MPVFEPLPQATKGGHYKAATNKRWRPWYSAIADEMISDPKATIAQIAERLGRHSGTVAAIVASDTFKDYFARRRSQFSELHDFTITQRLGDVAEASLRKLAERIEGPESARIPTKQLTETAAMVLDRLGFAPKPGPSVVVNTNTNTGQQVLIPATSADVLERARSALRSAEAANAAQAADLPALRPPSPAPEISEPEVLPPDRREERERLPPLGGAGAIPPREQLSLSQEPAPDDSPTPKLTDL